LFWSGVDYVQNGDFSHHVTCHGIDLISDTITSLQKMISGVNYIHPRRD
jgi:hypothetical protein